MSQSLNSFLMDEQLEPMDAEDAGTTVQILKPHKAGDDIELKDDVVLAAPLSDSEVVALEANIIDLLDLEKYIRTTGMSQTVALEMDAIAEDKFINDSNPLKQYTTEPTAVGVKTGLESVAYMVNAIGTKLYNAIKNLWEQIKAFGARVWTFLKDGYDRYSYLINQKLRAFDHGLDLLTNAAVEYLNSNGEDRAAQWLKENKEEYLRWVSENDACKAIAESDDARALVSNFEGMANNTIKRARLIIKDNNTIESLDKLQSLRKDADKMMLRDIFPDKAKEALKFLTVNIASSNLDTKEVSECTDKIHTRFAKGSVESNSITDVPSYRNTSAYLELVFATLRDIKSVSSLHLKTCSLINTFLQSGENVQNGPAFKNMVKFARHNAPVANAA